MAAHRFRLTSLREPARRSEGARQTAVPAGFAGIIAYLMQRKGEYTPTFSAMLLAQMTVCAVAGDLPLKFHPAAIRASALIFPKALSSFNRRQCRQS